MLKTFFKNHKAFGSMMKSYKILKFQHLTVNVDGQPGLIHALAFIIHIS